MNGVQRRTSNGIGMTSARTRERLIERLKAEGIKQPPPCSSGCAAVPRHLFVDEALASRAYEDTALPIGFGQTISQPYIVARMTEALIAGGKKLTQVLEIGTGCGYQTAVLAPFVQHVYSVERIQPLVQRARGDARRAEDQQRELAARGRLARLAQSGAVPRDHRRGRAGAYPARALRAARRRRPDRHPDRCARPADACCASRATATSSCARICSPVSFVPFVEGTELVT